MIRTKLTRHLLLALSIVSLPAFLFSEASLAYTIRTSGIVAIPANSQTNFNLSCLPADPLVHSGGFNSSAVNAGFLIIDSYPLNNNTWGFRLRNNSNVAQNVRFYIVCD